MTVDMPRGSSERSTTKRLNSMQDDRLEEAGAHIPKAASWRDAYLAERRVKNRAVNPSMSVP